MNDGPPILLLTSCTATKAPAAPNGPVRAEDLYTGQQHVRLMRGVRAYRAAGQPAGPVRVRIVSAGHGLVSSSTRISPYDESFNGLSRSGIRDRATALNVPASVRMLLRRDWALVVVLLGDDYLAAIDLDEEVEFGARTVALCGPRVAERLPQHQLLKTLNLGTPEAKRYSCPLIALKGELAGRMLTEIARRPAQLKQLERPSFSWLDWLDGISATSMNGSSPRTSKPSREGVAPNGAQLAALSSPGSVRGDAQDEA